MPPKRSRSAAAAHASGGGGRPLTPDPSPSPKRVKASAGSLGGTQRKLEAYFTSPKKPKSQSAGAGAPAQRRDSTRYLEQPEVIVIDDDQGEHQDSIRLPSQHSNERRPAAAAGNATDCGAGLVIMPATPMEEVRLGVRHKDENRGRGIEGENDMDTDTLLASRLARLEGGIEIELAKRLELDSTFRTGINRPDGLGSPSNASPNVRELSPFPLFNLNFLGSLTANAAAP